MFAYNNVKNSIKRNTNVFSEFGAEKIKSCQQSVRLKTEFFQDYKISANKWDSFCYTVLFILQVF